MWLLIVQGLLVNAYVGVRQDMHAASGLAVAGILVTLSAHPAACRDRLGNGRSPDCMHACRALHWLGLGAEDGRGGVYCRASALAVSLFATVAAATVLVQCTCKEQPR